ncbi:hypothetical protein SALBM135S_01633 [Streptomyces alboniger]
MSTKTRLQCAVLSGAAMFALSATVAFPAQADEQPSAELVKVEMPADLEIVEATPATAATPAPDSAAASRAPSRPCLGVTSTYGSAGCFQPYGDLIWTQDTASDGLSSVTVVYTDYGRPAYGCVNSNKADSWGYCNKDYKEKGNVRLKVLRYDSKTKDWYQPIAQSDLIPVDGQ